MARAIRQVAGGLIVGSVKLEDAAAKAVHDGDTINVLAAGGFGIRFLGIDTPEISFTPPNAKGFLSLARPEWAAFLDNPLAAKFGAFTGKLPPGLVRWLKKRAGPGCAANHHKHAEAGRVSLAALIEADRISLGRAPDNVPLFLIFVHEVMDRYGRLLAFVSPDQAKAKAADRLPSYNERQLVSGAALPYFIWPNVDPFIRDRSSLKPTALRKALARAKELQAGRKAVKAAREAGLGVFAKADPLRLAPFELRFLAGRRAPERWLIRLDADDARLVRPERYYTIPNDEDRLWLPAEAVPLFVEAGWKRR